MSGMNSNTRAHPHRCNMHRWKGRMDTGYAVQRSRLLKFVITVDPLLRGIELELIFFTNGVHIPDHVIPIFRDADVHLRRQRINTVAGDVREGTILVVLHLPIREMDVCRCTPELYSIPTVVVKRN